MGKVSKRLVGPKQLENTSTVQYTVPASTRAVIRKIEIINPEGGSSRTYTVGIGADAAGTRIRDAKTIAIGTEHIIWGPFTLEATEVLRAHASAATAVVMIVDGEVEALA